MVTEEFFSLVPSELFRPLASSGRRFYINLLFHLHEVEFSILGDTPSYKRIISSIAHFIDSQHDDLSFQDEGEDLLIPKADSSSSDQRRYVAYSRLVSTGWLIEHRDRYRKIVDFDPNARLILQFLFELSRGEARSYGGAVLSVLGSLEAAWNNPEDRSETLRNAAKSSESFARHLRTVSGAMRKIENEILSQTSLAGLLRQFFEEFVERHLIEDYKRLRTNNNPFRFRSKIIDLCLRFHDEPLKVQQLASAYFKEGRAASIQHGETIVLAEVDQVLRVFESLDESLRIIDVTTARLERRIRNTVRYMDRISDNNVGLLSEALKALGAAQCSDEAPVDAATKVLGFSLPSGPAHLYQGPKERRQIGRQALRIPPRDPAVLAFEKAKRQFFHRLQPTINGVCQYLESQLGTATQISGSDMQIRTLDDFIVFERLRELNFLFSGHLMRWYQVEPINDQVVANDWIVCSDFIVRRTAKGA